MYLSPTIHIIVGLTCIATHVTDCIKILVLKEENSTIWEEVGGGDGWDEEIIALDRDKSEDSFKKVCSALESGAWLVVDLTWSGWEEVMDLPGLRYIRADVTIAPFLKALESSLIKLRNSTDAALIFQHNRHFEQSLWYLVSESSLRVTVLEGLDEDSAQRLINMRPSPTSYVIIADTVTTNNILQKAIDFGLVFLDDKWNLLSLDMNYKKFNISLLVKKMMDITMTPKLCCPPGLNPPCICPEPFDWETEGVTQLKGAIQTAIELSLREGLSSTDINYDCSSPPMENVTSNHSIFYESFSKAVNESWLLDGNKGLGQTGLRLNVEISVSGGPITNYLGTWDTELGLKPAQVLPTVKRFFRIATGFLTPFAYNITRSNGDTVVVGYAIDLINRLAEMMNFEYELTTMWEFGTKDENGTWDGLIGLLVTGRVDMIIGALTMTSEREEVIDFVAPYFEQTGFSIVIRKPVKKTSLFKFMTVLRVEVWLSILGALCLTAIMIWLLDKYSPYSARNNKEKYPYPCRDFTLRESFWFAVTSFTPQGGGEAPKSLSARTLVAAYWLFVVLMLATFTANLAAFLTVERMQSPVQSLKHLARQSRINYTVVKNSDAHAYFENMKYAEEILYQKWKELTLNSSTDQSRFRVWDYPIKEQYGHIHNAITKAGPVANLLEGLRKVQESDDAEFALIHDHLELKYYVYSNCNLTQIGEPFAEQPYAIAVQQGSHLNEEISRRILDLQRERFFETASAKYWNSTEKAKCDSVDEDEGITLESLGGVFIATLVGLFLAMLTLGVEVWYHKKKVKGVVNTKDPKKKISIIKDEIFTSKEFSHHNISNKKTSLLPTKPKVNQIKVFPRGQLY